MIDVQLVLVARFVSFFFFQAEDGIRYLTVTGVQTCALPISVAADYDDDGWPDIYLAGRGVASEIDIRPPVIVVIGCHGRHGVTSFYAAHSGGLRHVRESAVPIVAIQLVAGGSEPTRAAIYRHIHVPAKSTRAWLGNSCRVEIEIARDEEVEVTVAIVVNPGGAGAPNAAGLLETRFLRHVRER